MHSIQRKRKRLIGEINVVPYIDVMLVLLIIFMVTTPLLNTGVKVDLPQAAAEPMQEQDQEPFIITVDKNGRVYLNDNEKPISSDKELELYVRAVLKSSPDLPFFVRGDSQATYEDVIHVMVIMKNTGVESVGLVTDPPQS